MKCVSLEQGQKKEPKDFGGLLSLSLLVFGFWFLAFGFWLLAFGFWLLALGHLLLALTQFSNTIGRSFAK